MIVRIFSTRMIFVVSITGIFLSASNAYALPEILNQIFKKKEPVEEVAPVVSNNPKEGSNIEEVLATLDEALKENRKLRQQLSSMEEDLRKGPMESNLLKSQIRSLQHELESAKQRNEADRKTLRDREAELNVNDAELKRRAAAMDAWQKRSEKRTQKLREDIEKFRVLLKSAILTEERDEYRELIKKSEEQTNRAIEEQSEMRRSYEAMQHQLADAYYDLGNKFFESKDYRNALAQFEKAITLNPGDAWAHHNLGVIYDYYVQDKEAALWHYQKYLQITPALEDTQAIRERAMELKLGSMVIPPIPLKSDFKSNTRAVEMRETKHRRHS